MLKVTHFSGHPFYLAKSIVVGLIPRPVLVAAGEVLAPATQTAIITNVHGLIYHVREDANAIRAALEK